jgi:CheY-like chemotaxis protein
MVSELVGDEMPTTLLLADDSVVIQKLVGLSFVNEDIEIVSVDNGDDAVTRARECNPDIILADVVMPGKSGYEVCAAIRNNPDLADTPVLLLTGTFEAFDETRANKVKATGHITKPFEAQMLVDRVNEILAQRTPAQATPAAAEHSNDFFADELLNAGESNATADFTPNPVSDQSDILTPAPLAPESTHGTDATSIAIEPIADLDDLLDGAGADHTVAIISDKIPYASEDTVPPATDYTSSEDAPTVSPSQFMPVDNFVSDATPLPGANTDPAPIPTPMPNVSVGASGTSTNTPGTLNLKQVDAPDPLAAFVNDSPAAALSPWHDEMASPIAPPSVPVSTSEFDDLGLGSESDISIDQLESSSLDASLLASDMFGGHALSDDLGGEFDDSFDSGIDTRLADPVGSDFPASQRLDIDFGAPASDAIVPENINVYDVSSSDVGFGAAGDAPSWSAGVPDDVETGPAPIMIPTDTTRDVDVMAPIPGVHMQAVSEYDSASEAPITLTEEPAARTPEADISFASSAPSVSPLDETIGATDTAPVLDIPAPAATASPTGSRPDLTPVMRDRIHDTLEKVAWEAFADLSDDIVRQLMERVEQIAWEVIPQMAETLLQDEIRRMKGEEGEE